jgi:predicted nucleotidyltransferase component of viral defense system
MIDRQEVMDFAREFSLAPQVIEKEYVLGWLLAGIAAHPLLAEAWAFKGGTCLKKCYFETYRFSEDLDFTLSNADHLQEDFLLQTFSEVTTWIRDQAGIDMPADTFRFEIYNNPRGMLSGQGRVGYRGPMGRGGDLPRIKLDLTDDEVLVLEPTLREVNHSYSDRPANGIHVYCYAFEEVFAEKIRALAERERPRDLYDVINLHRHEELRPNRELIFETLEKKCSFKGIPVPTFQQLEDSPFRAELETEWANMLAHQLPVLPAFLNFWQELPAVFDWLQGTTEKIIKPAIPISTRDAGDIDNSWQPPTMASAWAEYGTTPLEKIRFAAANHLCIDLDYVDEGGRRSTRIIEPYALRRTREMKLLLYAVKYETGEDRSYRVDRIRGAEVTKNTFEPRYLIELTPVGPTTVPTAKVNQ